MRCVNRFFIFVQILILVFIAGCAKPSLPEIGAIIEVHDAPHIVQDNVCYYIGHWGPGANVLKIYYEGSNEKGDSRLPGIYREYVPDIYYKQVTSIEWERINEEDLYFYIPLLIESMKDTKRGGNATLALRFLYSVVSMGVPRDYLIENTPIDSISEFRRLRSNMFPEVYEETYNKWKHWWDTEGHENYDPENFEE